MDVFFEYGEEVENEADSVEFHTYGVTRAGSAAAMDIWLHESQDSYVTWCRPITREHYLQCDLPRTDLVAEARERAIAKNIALAVRRKRLARSAYKAPTLATLWPPTGA